MTNLGGGPGPAGPERRQVPELEDFLSRAVDRQIAQQRALAEALSELRGAVEELAARDSEPSEPPVALTNALSELRDAVHSLTSRAGEPVDTRSIEKVIRDVSEGEVSFFVRELKELRESAPREESAETTQRLRDLAQDVETVNESVGGVASDIDGIAQALIDLNSGLRGWADGVDSNIATLRDSVDRVHEMTMESQELLTTRGEDADGARVGAAALGDRIQGVEDRVAEAAELSSYLTEQVESLDKLLNRIGDLPMKLEGVVAQALRRTLATRAKLDKEAETAIDDVLGNVDEQLERFSGALERFGSNEERLKNIETGQSDLTSRLEALQDALVGRLEQLDTDRRRTEQALAQAIDRSAKGLAPRALDSVNKPSRRAAKPVKPKAKPKPVVRKAAAGQKTQTKRTRKSSSRRRISPPIIEISDEPLE